MDCNYQLSGLIAIARLTSPPNCGPETDPPPSSDQAGLSPTSLTPVSSARPVSSLSQPVVHHSQGGPVSHSSPRYPPQYLQQGQPTGQQQHQPAVSSYSGGYTQQQGQYWGYQQPVE